MIGQSVYGPDDQTIGEVNDLVLQEDGKTRSALIDVGGFLGVGEKTVAIPFTDIQVQQEQNTDNLHLTVAMTKEQLEQLPAYQQPDRLAATTPPAGEQPANGAATGNNMAATDGTNAAGDQSTGQMAAAPAEGSDNVVTGSLPQEGYQLATQDLPASELIGATVYGQGDESIGEINDVVFNKDGQIDAVVLDVGGFLGIGEKPVAVGFDQLNVRTDDGGNLLVMINAPKEQLENAPTYQESAQAQ
jgi:sporulation protein YlmC with PRC-barrel domain